METKNVLGIDVSKNTLDCHLYPQNKSLGQVSNDQKGFQKISKLLKKEVGQDLQGVMVVMEHTGLYTFFLERYLGSQNIAFCKRHAPDIVHSSGIKRGKSDPIDARFISRYGWQRKDELIAGTSLSDTEIELKQLRKQRELTVSNITSCKAKITELRAMLGKSVSQTVVKVLELTLENEQRCLKIIEAAIKKLIGEDQALNRNFELVTSVTGIGFVAAVDFLVFTRNFTAFQTDRQLMCYCGVAPFEHSSGTSVRGKTRVSAMANKPMKKSLTMSAFSAIQHDPQLKAKYEQKLKEGKSKMCALNNIRAKLIARVMAVVRSGQLYEVRQAA